MPFSFSPLHVLPFSLTSRRHRQVLSSSFSSLSTGNKAELCYDSTQPVHYSCNSLVPFPIWIKVGIAFGGAVREGGTDVAVLEAVVPKISGET